MDPWRWCCSIAALMDWSKAPPESELSVVAPLPSITTSWLTSSWIENILKNFKKYLLSPLYSKNSDRPSFIANARNLGGNLLEEIKHDWKYRPRITRNTRMVRRAETITECVSASHSGRINTEAWRESRLCERTRISHELTRMIYEKKNWRR